MGVPDTQTLRFPVICGPTAGGKSALALALVHHLHTHHAVTSEIVTADAYQIYKGMDIGTAKPTPAERAAVPHHLIDLVEPTERFTLDQWLDAANAKVAELRSRNVLPIVVGGTHLYIKALMEGLFEGPAADPALRAELEALDPAARRAQLERADPAAALRIHPNDLRRTVRALEVHRLTGRPISDHQQQWDRAGAARPDALLVPLHWPTDLLNRRINARVRQMIDQGLLDEVRRVAAHPGFGPQAREAIGYKQLLPLLESKGIYQSSLDDAIERIKIDTRRFGKAQRTWLKRLSLIQGSCPIDAAAGVPESAAQVIARKVLTPA